MKWKFDFEIFDTGSGSKVPHGAEVRAASCQAVPEEAADAVQQGPQDEGQEVSEVPYCAL